MDHVWSTLVLGVSQYGRQEGSYGKYDVGLHRHSSRQRLRIHCRLRHRHRHCRQFPISSVEDEFLTLDLSLSNQLDAVHKALETTRLFPKRVAFEPTLREELVDLWKELFGKRNCLRFALCAKRLGPADLQAVEPGDEDPV